VVVGDQRGDAEPLGAATPSMLAMPLSTVMIRSGDSALRGEHRRFPATGRSRSFEAVGHQESRHRRPARAGARMPTAQAVAPSQS
jgi:hypothetical protein